MKEEIKEAIIRYLKIRGSIDIFVEEFPSELADYIVHQLEDNNVIIMYPIQKGNTKVETI